ncbi:MAG: MerR family transcriptional regulator [Pseudomonadales bacterium]
MQQSSFASSPQPAGTLNVAAVARRANVTPATVRYYARIGLLNPGRDLHNGYRRFSQEDLRRVAFVRKAQAIGLSISDIRSLLEQIGDGLPVCDLVVQLVQGRLDEVRRQRAELQATEQRMAHALSEWQAMPMVPPGSGELCRLIEGVELGDGASRGPCSPQPK